LVVGSVDGMQVGAVVGATLGSGDDVTCDERVAVAAGLAALPADDLFGEGLCACLLVCPASWREGVRGTAWAG
jgi:hypothetical protein